MHMDSTGATEDASELQGCGAGSDVTHHDYIRPFTVSVNYDKIMPIGGEMAQWLKREFTDRKVRGSNSKSASRLPLSRVGQPGNIPALVLPSGRMAAKYRKGVTAERLSFINADC
ncbi:hypothetical protein CSKR_102258 [Clonorchis sinensis]|uniref:Uncharacterized protein n=1 Tax=Clonorchis sinensis TaxID=79923 RepID=A0A3R7EMS6_CLOSI|nr:hypothetical protein CSKR_102258 [Clonorchis sinensis]